MTKLQHRFAALTLCTAAFMAWPQWAHAQTAENNVEDEYKKLIKVDGAIQPLGETPFGENISLYDGTVSFEQTDVSLRGIGLPLSISRQHRPGTLGHSHRIAAFGDWDWDLPRITTFVSALPGPQGTTAIGGQWLPASRCSQFAAQPAPAALSSPFELPFDLQLGDWWSGYQLISSEGGSQEVLLRASGNTLTPTMSGTGIPTSFPLVTTKHWMIGCLPQTSNGQSGEGFFVVSPNGNKYWLDRLVYEQGETLRYPRFSSGGTNHQPVVFRMRASMLVTRIEDRFGNSMTFTYADSTSKKISQITTSDGRQLSIQWRSDSPYINSITLQPQTSSPRTWTYGYATPTDDQNVRLTSVTLPDGKQWTFNLTFTTPTFYADDGLFPTCDVNTALAGDGSAAQTGTITHPSGLTGTFTLQMTRHGRSYAPKDCRNAGTAPTAKLFRVPVVYADLSMKSKQLSGPNVNQTWSYVYSAPNASFQVDCSGGTCPSTVTTTVTEPDSTSSVYTFSNKWGETEGKLLQTDIRDTAATIVRTVASSYALANTGPWPNPIGTMFTTNVNTDQITRLTPSNLTTTTESGDTYTWQALQFNKYGDATQTKRFNSIANQALIQELVTFANDDAAFQSRWVLGKVKQVDNQSATLTVRSTTYDASALPQSRFSFGLKVMDYTWNTNGTLASFSDGLARATSLSNYKLGIPRLITFPDSTTESIVVSDFSEVTGVTDPNGSTNNYQYDSMSRLTQTDFPTGDVVAWASTTNSYTVLTAAELGIPAGSWRARSTTGALQVSTYFDALLQPVLIEEKDTVRGTTIYRKKSFDHEGRVTFESYPAAVSTATAGINSSYDTLGRLKQKQTTDAITLEQHAYLSGAREQVTDADNKVRTMTYQVFDSPAYSNVLRIDDPESRTTVYQRDLFGKLLSATQSGTWSGGSVTETRTWQYDSNQRLCRRTEPETGSTVYGYDAASQIIWDAKGQSGTGCVSTAPAGATTYSYYSSGRKQLDDFPGINDDTSYTYDSAGNLKTVTNASATWSYDYNKLNLLEREQVTIDGLTRVIDPSYDTQGHLSQKIFPDGTSIAYTPDAWGRPTQVGSYVTSIQYHSTGDVSTYTLGNGLTYTQTLDAQLRPHTQETKNGTAAVQSFTYSYSNAGDLLSVTESADGADTASFGYDGLHRVTSATGLWGTYGYVYDPLNNIRSRSGSGALSYSYDSATNRLTSVTGGATRSYSYNAAGEIIGDGVHTFSVNPRGQINCISSIATYVYDGNAKRIKSVKSAGPEYTLYDKAGSLVYLEGGSGKTIFLQLKGHTLIELATANSVTTPTYLHDDWLGSPRKATNSARTVLWNETFSPYGQKLNGVNERVGYTGHVQDADSEITYMQARFYDQALGRFLSPDPIRSNDDFNLFAYVGDNPMTRIDPLGLYTCSGSKQQCAAVDKAVSKAKEAESKMKDGSKEKKTLSRVLALLGDAGQDNGVKIGFSNAVVVGAASIEGDGRTVDIKLGTKFDTFGQGYNGDPGVTRAGILAHEGQHGVDLRAMGRDSATKSESIETERRAYEVQSQLHKALGEPSMQRGLWSNAPDFSESARANAVESWAERSTAAWCGGAGTGSGC